MSGDTDLDSQLSVVFVTDIQLLYLSHTLTLQLKAGNLSMITIIDN